MRKQIYAKLLTRSTLSALLLPAVLFPIWGHASNTITCVDGSLKGTILANSYLVSRGTMYSATNITPVTGPSLITPTSNPSYKIVPLQTKKQEEVSLQTKKQAILTGNHKNAGYYFSLGNEAPKKTENNEPDEAVASSAVQQTSLEAVVENAMKETPTECTMAEQKVESEALNNKLSGTQPEVFVCEGIGAKACEGIGSKAKALGATSTFVLSRIEENEADERPEGLNAEGMQSDFPDLSEFVQEKTVAELKGAGTALSLVVDAPVEMTSDVSLKTSLDVSLDTAADAPAEMTLSPSFYDVLKLTPTQLAEENYKALFAQILSLLNDVGEDYSLAKLNTLYSVYKNKKANLSTLVATKRESSEENIKANAIKIQWFLPNAYPELNSAYEAVMSHFLSASILDDSDALLNRMNNISATFGEIIRKRENAIKQFEVGNKKTTDDLDAINKKAKSEFSASKKKVQDRFQRALFDFALTRDLIIYFRTCIQGYADTISMFEATATPEQSLQSTQEQKIAIANKNISYIRNSILNVEVLMHALYPFVRGTLSTLLNKMTWDYYTQSQRQRFDLTGLHRMPDVVDVSLDFSANENNATIDSAVLERTQSYLENMLYKSHALDDAVKEGRIQFVVN